MPAEAARARLSPKRIADPPGGSARALAQGVLGTLKLAPAGHVPWLDGWRGLCIAMVLIGHFVPVLGHLAPLGVEMFFVLSGRLMAELLIVRRQPLPLFVLRRASRILPLLALYTGIVAIGLAAGALLGGRAVNWLSPVATLLFFSNYLPDPAPLLEHSWSLAVEEHSYLLLVLVAAISTRKAAIASAVAAILAIAMVCNGVIQFYDGVEGGAYVFWRSDVRAASVLFSFAFCLWLRGVDAQRPARILAWLSPLCWLGALACMYPADPMTPLQLTGLTIFAALSVNTIQFAPERWRQLLALPALTWLGTLSFSLYIWQQPFFLASKAGFPVAAAVLLTFACAVWSFLRVEAPARRALNARWTRLRPPPEHPILRPAE
jgi:peptidoglycan/LPS O-acetylase OafA/YrhL